MSRVLTNEQNYYDIANTIRQMKNVNTTYKPREMASALKDIYSNEVEGTLPLSFEANGNNLLDYRIDGASGGVGDRTKNLLPPINEWTKGYINSEGTITNASTSKQISSPYIEIDSNTDYAFSFYPNEGSPWGCIAFYTNDKIYIDRVADYTYTSISSTTPDNAKYIRVSYRTYGDGTYAQLEEGSTVTDYEPYGYKVPVMVEGKNLLQNTATSQTINGLTFTVNTDGSVTCNGRRENTTTFFTIANVTTSGKIILSGCPSGGSSTSFAMRAFSATVSNPRVYYDIGDSCMLNTPDTYNIDIRIQSNYACDNLTFYPMIRKADIEDDTYEPYIEPTTTNIYLDEPIEARANIPNEYEEVEYLESTGTQYIDTGINVNTTTSRYETKINPSSVSGTMGIFGTRNNSMASQSSMNVFIIGGTFRLDWLSGNGNYNVRNISTNTEYTISITRGLATINNVNYTSGETISIDSLYPFYVGSFNNVGSVFSTGFSGKIYYSKLYNNNILVFDGVPCYRKSDNEIGMYDLVSNTFFTNAGTGNFIVGPIKENESISLSDTNVNIPTIDGTNVISIDTTVQPSNVYIQAPKDTPKMVEARERLEVI